MEWALWYTTCFLVTFIAFAWVAARNKSSVDEVDTQVATVMALLWPLTGLAGLVIVLAAVWENLFNWFKRGK